MRKHDTSVARLHINGSKNTPLNDLLAAQYSHLEKGELRALLETKHARVWSEEELLQSFTVHNESDNVATVTHKATKQHGTVVYIDSPRLYFDFEEKSNDE